MFNRTFLFIGHVFFVAGLILDGMAFSWIVNNPNIHLWPALGFLLLFNRLTYLIGIVIGVLTTLLLRAKIFMYERSSADFPYVAVARWMYWCAYFISGVFTGFFIFTETYTMFEIESFENPLVQLPVVFFLASTWFLVVGSILVRSIQKPLRLHESQKAA